jgi:UDP-glucose:(heptosyl)LPS alpha-1,3-glucosyltransferase
MKIALVYEKFISRGGLENYLFSFARELSVQGHHLEIVTSQTDEVTEKLTNTEFHRLPAAKKSKTLHMRKFAKLAEQKVAEIGADVSIGFGRTVAHDFHRAGGGCHLEYSKLLNPLKRFGAKNQMELALERELYTSGKTRHFVVNSELVQRQLQAAYGLDASKFTVVHTAVDSEKFKPAEGSHRQALREKIAIDPKRPAFLFISMNHRRKGLDAMLRAWQLIRANHDAELWIVGPRPGMRQIAAINKLKITESIRIFPPTGSVVPYYQAADFFMHPTKYDACANTVLQSMACGLPGVISANDGAVQFVDEGETGFTLHDPLSVSEILTLSERCLELDSGARQRMAEAARAKMLPLTWPAHVAKWMKLIEST